MTILTERLELVSLPLELIDAVLDGDLVRAGQPAPYDVDATTFDGDDHVLRLRQAQLRAEPGQLPWLLRAAVLRGTRQVVGRVGFHAPPDGAGSAEVGYSVAPSYRRSGFATEMAAALIEWGAEHGVQVVVASVRPDNAPSLAVVAKLGFERVGEQIDEIDGLEWVFTRRVVSAAESPGSSGGFA